MFGAGFASKADERVEKTGAKDSTVFGYSAWTWSCSHLQASSRAYISSSLGKDCDLDSCQIDIIFIRMFYRDYLTLAKFERRLETDYYSVLKCMSDTVQYNSVEVERVNTENFRCLHLLCVLMFICALIVLTFEIYVKNRSRRVFPVLESSLPKSCYVSGVDDETRASMTTDRDDSHECQMRETSPQEESALSR